MTSMRTACMPTPCDIPAPAPPTTCWRRRSRSPGDDATSYPADPLGWLLVTARNVISVRDAQNTGGYACRRSCRAVPGPPQRRRQTSYSTARSCSMPSTSSPSESARRSCSWPGTGWTPTRPPWSRAARRAPSAPGSLGPGHAWRPPCCRPTTSDPEPSRAPSPKDQAMNLDQLLRDSAPDSAEMRRQAPSGCGPRWWPASLPRRRAGRTRRRRWAAGLVGCRRRCHDVRRRLTGRPRRQPGVRRRAAGGRRRRRHHPPARGRRRPGGRAARSTASTPSVNFDADGGRRQFSVAGARPRTVSTPREPGASPTATVGRATRPRWPAKATTGCCSSPPGRRSRTSRCTSPPSRRARWTSPMRASTTPGPTARC